MFSHKRLLVLTIVVALGMSMLNTHYGKAEGIPMLKEIYEEDFRIGFAARSSFWLDEPLLDHFNAVTAENIMKWDSIHPREGVYNFSSSDALIDYAEKHGMSVTGHTLVWHNQTPNWVFVDESGQDVSREELLARMEEHIKTVVGRYKGRVKGWDVVNEAIDQNPETGRWELRDSKWREIIGDDFIEYAFRFAHEADPDAELYYNDYSATDPGKRDAIYALVKGLLDKGIRVDGIGMQGHWEINAPSEYLIREAIEKYSSLGVKVHITELDISVFSWNDRSNRYADGLPDDVAARQGERYASVFRLFKEYASVIDRVTFWGVKDNYSWKNNFPVQGRRDYPLLFDKDGKPKPSFWAVVDPTRPWYEVKAEYEGTADNEEFTRNVVLNRSVTSSSDVHRAGKAVDGSDQTSWSESTEPPYWLAVELDDEYLIKRWVVKHAGASAFASGGPGSELFNTADFKLQKSDDGEVWIDVDEVVGNTDSITSREVEPFNAKHVRLVVTRPTSISDNNRLSIVEFEVYGVDSQKRR
ncbi:MAG: hypothetical protein GX331_06070 [Firmicutes bacterium]|nr:hypothetical protein [Bacillota bacterium]